MTPAAVKPLTPSQQKAVEILMDHPGLRPREFAEKMWPEAEGWNRISKCGPYGSTRGGGMCLGGGGYLGRLRKIGLVRMWFGPTYNEFGWTVTKDAINRLRVSRRRRDPH